MSLVSLVRYLTALVLAAGVWVLSPAIAQGEALSKLYAPPPSYNNASLQGRDFSGEYLPGALFSQSNLELANFENAYLEGAVFSISKLLGTNFRGADLTGAMLDQDIVTKADFTDAILREVIFLRTIFDQPTIAGADFTDALLEPGQVRALCAIASGINSKTKVVTVDSLGC